MMKNRNVLCSILAALMLLMLSACGGATTDSVESAQQPETSAAPAAMQLTAAAQQSFPDVAEDAWYADAVRFVTERGLMDPMPNGDFEPNAETPREIIAESLWRANGRKTASAEAAFSDMPAANKAAIDWAVEAGVVSGMGNGRFGSGLSVSRQDFAVMLWRAAGKPAASGSVSFGDAASISDYAKEAAMWTEEQGIINGIGGNFEPRSSVTRAQVATILQRYLTNEESTQGNDIQLTVAGRALTVEWEDNSTVDALRALLRRLGPITLDMSDYAGFEKGAPLPETLPQNNEPMNTDAGDIILYQGRQFVIYYDQNSYSLTPLGKITGMTKAELQALVGAGNVTATLSLSGGVAAAVTGEKPVVYFTSDISSAGLVAAYEALNWTPGGRVAVKVSTGEPPASNYLRAELIGDLVRQVNGTIVECNTAYGGSRSSSAMHKQVAADHGFTAIADFDLMDEDGEVEWPVTGGTRLNRIIVGSHAENYSDWLILSHYKGHQMAGFGGAIKNVGIGASSASGKVLVHTAGTKTSGSIWYSNQDAWLEALAEMVDGFVDHVGRSHIVYINVMNRLSVDCDCNGHPAEPDIHDIGILASTDPVALDQACYDLVAKADGNTALMNRIERQHGLHTLEHAEEIGLGSRTYTLVDIG